MFNIIHTIHNTYCSINIYNIGIFQQLVSKEILTTFSHTHVLLNICNYYNKK